MDLCVIDWTATAAWVQAIGSIGAIVAAIIIGNRQHNQSVALVDKQHKQNIEQIEVERQRIREDAHREAIEESRDLKELVLILLDPFIRNSHQRLTDFEPLKGHIEPLGNDAMEEIRKIETEAEKTKKQLVELRDVFVRRPRHLLVHGHLIGALTLIVNACNHEKSMEGLRVYRESQIKQKPFNGPHVQIIPEQPFDTEELIKSFNYLQKVFSTVGE